MDAIIRRALDEDLPDITTDSIFGPEERGSAHFIAKQRGVIAGLAVAARVFEHLDPNARFHPLVSEGDHVEPGTRIADLEATVRALLSGERTALNMMQRASGIATATRHYAGAVAGTRAKILDTRKTAPGLRPLDKEAVAAGGGENHRFGLFDMILLKNNHIDRAGSIHGAALRARRASMGRPIMIEVRDLVELEQALEEAPDFVLLDNMSIEMMTEAVRRTAGRTVLEASGGISLESVRSVAETGVDRISIGALTHSVTALDISMRIV
ncbi:MAG TPA: carboxylating nicotinate-nucleotide diphosphorylase [Thermoanaerobaculia bacterium]|nr:carboxylating nicotinate-nucleotide diphosphorylase [Thermoanaerobaculia bacterium]